MSTEWKQYNLGQIVDVAQGLAINAKTKHLIKDSGLPLLRITDLINNTASQFVDPLGAPKQSYAEETDLIFTRTGQVGLVFKGRMGVIHNNCFKVIPNKEKVDSNFLYWFLFQESTREHANSIASGSVQKDLPHSAFKSIAIKLPSLEVQKKIATILSSLNEKIDLNRQTAQTLEAIAQALFKEWFVDFNFPGATGEMEESELGMIPKGWRVGKVGDICEVNKNSITKKDKYEYIDYIEISEVQGGKVGKKTRYKWGEEPSRAKRKIKDGDTVLSTVRPDRGAYFLALQPEKEWIVSTGFAVFTPTIVPFTFLYLFLTDPTQLEYYGHVADGGAYPAINPSVILDVNLVVPNSDVLTSFHNSVSPILKCFTESLKEIEALSSLRDELLPKLINGTITIQSEGLEN